eukprot:SAG25_NODE_4549_length_792_cov_1.204906_2_plen_117_part_01
MRKLTRGQRNAGGGVPDVAHDGDGVGQELDEHGQHPQALFQRGGVRWAVLRSHLGQEGVRRHVVDCVFNRHRASAGSPHCSIAPPPPPPPFPFFKKPKTGKKQRAPPPPLGGGRLPP